MAKFVFKLEPLFEYRQRLEEICQKEFSEALRRLDEESSKLEVLRELYRKSSSELDELKENGGEPASLELYVDYMQGLKMHIEAQNAAICHFNSVLEARRAELLKAAKDRKVIEVIKDKSRHSHLARAQKEEQKASDDLVSSRFKRRSDD